MKHFLGLVRSGHFLFGEEKKQKEYLSQYLQKILSSLEEECNGHFAPSLKIKIEKFYALFGPVLLCSAICKLYGKHFTTKEREMATLLGIISPLYDNFFDDGTLTAEAIVQLTNNPQNYKASTFEERVFKKLHVRLGQEVCFPQLYKECFNKVRLAQNASIRQTNFYISEADLYQITYEKCYHSILLFHTVLSIAPTDDFKKMIYPFAGLLQLGNDVFDVYKDLQEGIFTIPNLNRNWEEFKIKFVAESAAFNRRVMQLPYPYQQKEDFKNAYNAIIALSWVGIKALEKVVKCHPPPYDLKQLPRKKLIVDMEKWGHKVLWLKYIYLFSKLK